MTLEEEMAVLARTGRAARDLLDMLATSVALYVYGLGAAGGALTGLGLAQTLGLEEMLAAAAGAGVGFVLATILLVWVSRLLPRTTARKDWRRDIIVVVIVFVVVENVFAALTPGAGLVAAVPALGAALLYIGYRLRDARLTSAGAGILAKSSGLGTGTSPWAS